MISFEYDLRLHFMKVFRFGYLLLRTRVEGQISYFSSFLGDWSVSWWGIF